MDLTEIKRCCDGAARVTQQLDRAPASCRVCRSPWDSRSSNPSKTQKFQREGGRAGWILGEDDHLARLRARRQGEEGGCGLRRGEARRRWTAAATCPVQPSRRPRTPWFLRGRRGPRPQPTDVETATQNPQPASSKARKGAARGGKACESAHRATSDTRAKHWRCEPTPPGAKARHSLSTARGPRRPGAERSRRR